MKKLLFSLLLVGIMLFSISAFGEMYLTDDALIFSEAIEKLLHIDGRENVETARERFDEITSNYNQSKLFSIYASAVLDIYDDRFHDALNKIDVLMMNSEFIDHLHQYDLPNCSVLQKYIEGRELEDEGKFDEAVSIYRIVWIFDSADRIIALLDSAKEQAYEKADTYFSVGDFEAAYEAFSALGTYKDCTDRAIESATKAEEERKQEQTESVSEAVDVTEETDTPTSMIEELPIRNKPYKAAVLVPGTLGDKSFWDSTNEGLTALNQKLGDDMFQFEVVEMGAGADDMSSYPDFFLDACEDGGYDVIITGSWTAVEAMTEAMEEYPDQKFILFDEAFDYSNGGGENLYNLLFKQNEVAFLVGACAELLSDSDIISFLGGMEGNIINDFLVGYIQGALEVNPDAKIAVSFVGNYEDSAKGKDLSLAMFNAGADVGFNVAGNAGMGLLEAAKEDGKLAFGVDSDQAALNPDLADYIPTSALKNVGKCLAHALLLDMTGDLKYGQAVKYGLAENGVGLLDDDHYKEMVPEEIRYIVYDLQKKIASGEIEVYTTSDPDGMDSKAVEELKASVTIR